MKQRGQQLSSSIDVVVYYRLHNLHSSQAIILLSKFCIKIPQLTFPSLCKTQSSETFNTHMFAVSSRSQLLSQVLQTC